MPDKSLSTDYYYDDCAEIIERVLETCFQIQNKPPASLSFVHSKHRVGVAQTSVRVCVRVILGSKKSQKWPKNVNFSAHNSRFSLGLHFRYVWREFHFFVGDHLLTDFLLLRSISS